MLLHDIVATSRRVASTSARLGKIAHIATALRALTLDEVEIGVAFLAGAIRQRRLGIGPAALRSARTAPAAEPSLELREVYRQTRRLQSELIGIARRGGVRLTHNLESMEPEDIVAEALRHFGSYHKRAAATRQGDRLFATDRNLLFYYQNRVEGYRLERGAGLAPALSGDHRTLGAA